MASNVGNPVQIRLTVDGSNHVTVEPHGSLHYDKPNPDFADWRINPKSAPFVFTIKFDKYTGGPPPEHLPEPKCEGQGMGYHCRSVNVEKKYRGKHQYSIWVKGVVTDPEVTIDP